MNLRVVPALDRGLRILALLAQRGQRMRVSEIAEVLKLPRSATYELISTLAVHGAIRHYPNNEVGLGHQTLVFGSAYSRTLDFGAVAQSIADSIMHECDETVQVGVLEGRHVLYIAKAESRKMVRLVSSIGARLPAHCTALGKVLLAHLPDGELRQLLGTASLEPLTAYSITDTEKLSCHLERVRKTGFASEQCESNADVACVAAPVWDADGRNVAAVSISIPAARSTDEQLRHLSAVVIAGAARMSAELGFAPSLHVNGMSDDDANFIGVNNEHRQSSDL